MLSAQVKIGADPELILADSGGSPRIGVGLIGGTKKSPRRVVNGALQEDNVLAEINIDPADSEDTFVGNLSLVLDQLNGIISKSGLVTTTLSSAEYDMDELRSSDQCRKFGCEPDYNIYTMQPQEVDVFAIRNLRTAGGHIHIGYPNPSKETSTALVKACDVFLGIESILIDHDTKRREFYGKAGSFRPKAYGIEYRTLSNFWIHSLDYMKWAYNGAMAATKDVLDCDAKITNKIQSKFDVQSIINSGDKEAAQAALMYKNRLEGVSEDANPLRFFGH